MAVRPFAAASTDRFARLGYVDEDSTGRTYYAPDAEVLLDESFAATHCFAVRLGDAEHPDQIGLAFTPTPERDTLVEISGTLWVDRAITALRSLEFRYTALEPAAMRSDAGGDLTFRSVGNGVAFVERWSLRLPVLIPAVGDPPLTGLIESRLRTSNSRLRVAEVEEAGGMVTEARWRDGTVWMARPVGLTGVVRESTSDSPVPGAIVSLVETSDSTVSDRVGAFTLTPLVPGHYTLAVTDTTLSMVTIPRRATFDVEVKPDQLIHVSPRVESIDALIPRVCDRALGGTVNDVRLIAGRLALLPDTLGAGPPLLNALMATDRDTISVELTVDSRGRFVACAPQGVHDALLRLSLRTFAADTSISPGPTRVTSFEWRPTFRLVSRQATARSVRGVVLDSAGRPLARVTVSAAGATVPPAVSDDSGAFRLRLANRDAIVLDFRRVAFAPARYGLGAGGDTILTVTLLPTVQRLEGVTVTDAPPTSANLRGFEERLRKRARGILGGTFITEEQIEKRNPTQVTQLFLDIPSVRVLRVNPLYQRYSIFGVSRQMGDRGPAMCPAAVYIDGIRALEGGDDLGTKERQTGGSVRDVREAGVAINDLVLPSQIKGIEVYTNSMDVPPQYQSLNGGCIVVLVWTK